MPHHRIRHLMTTLSLLALLCGGPAAAGETLLLSLDTARQLALENNTALRRQANDTTLGQVAVDQARAALYPNLSLSASTSERYDRTVDPADGDLDSQWTGSLNLQASSTLNLFNGFGDVAVIASAQQSAAASAGDLQRTREFILYQVTVRFLQAVLDSQLVEIETERLAAERRQLERIESLHDVGERPWADVLQQHAAVARAELDQLGARRAYEIDILSLKETMALDPDDRVELVADGMVRITDGETDLQALQSDALTNRADLLAQAARVRAAEESLRAARSGYWPGVDLTVGAGSSYSSRNSAFDFDDQLFDANPSASIGLSVSLPVFDRDLTDAAVSRARIQLADGQLAYDALVRDVGLQLEQALLNYRIAVAQLAVTERQLEYTREALAATEARYFEGLATLVEVSQARAQYVEAAGGHATAEVSVTLRQFDIELQRGGNSL